MEVEFKKGFETIDLSAELFFEFMLEGLKVYFSTAISLSLFIPAIFLFISVFIRFFKEGLVIIEESQNDRKDSFR
jgi:hypothetical protein